MRFVPDNETQVWQCVPKRGACRKLVQHAACKLLINSSVGNKQLDNEGKMLREGNKTLWIPLCLKYARVPAPLGGQCPDAAEHGLS